MDEPTAVTATSSSRKRNRAASPRPGASAGGGVAAFTSTNINNDSSNNNATATKQRQHEVLLEQSRCAAQLRDPNQRVAALNELLRGTSTHETNYSLLGDDILQELVNIVAVDCLDWNDKNNNDDDNDNASSFSPTFSSQYAWTRHPTTRGKDWAQHCQTHLGPMHQNCRKTEKLQTAEVVLVILRNLSFVSANLRLLAYSPRVLDLLVGCLYEEIGSSYITSEDISSGSSSTASSSANSSSMALSAIHTLVNLAPYLDVSGQRLLADRLFYKPLVPGVDDIGGVGDGPMVPSSTSTSAQKFGQAVQGNWGFGGLWLAKRLDSKEDAIADVTKEFLLDLTSDYLVAVWGIFPALAHVLANPHTTRAVVLLAMDLLQEFINHARVGVVGSVQENDAKDDKLPSIRAILVNMPDPMLRRLIDLLYVPRLGPDSLEYIDPVHNIVTRVTTLKLLMGYDATVDTDARDRSLDTLVPLLELDSPRMAARLGSCCCPTIARLLEAVVPILTTNVGRNEAPVLANQLLRELALAEENKSGFAYVQERLVELASRDSRVSQLVWNHLYPNPPKEEDDDDGEVADDDEDDGEQGESGDEEREEEDEEMDEE